MHEKIITDAIEKNITPYLSTKVLIRLDRGPCSFTEVYEVTEYYLDKVIKKEEPGKIHFIKPINFNYD